MEEEKKVDEQINNEKAEEKKEKTWNRDEVNKMISAEKKKVREEVRAEMEAEKNEAERLAKLTSEERFKEELAKANKVGQDALNELNAYKLKEQVVKDNTDIPVKLINLIDFKKYNTAELVKDQLATIKEVYKTAVEEGINESLKEKTPKTVVNGTTTKKQVSRYSI